MLSQDWEVYRFDAKQPWDTFLTAHHAARDHAAQRGAAEQPGQSHSGGRAPALLSTLAQHPSTGSAVRAAH